MASRLPAPRGQHRRVSPVGAPSCARSGWGHRLGRAHLAPAQDTAAWSRDASHRPHLAAGGRALRHLPTRTVSRVPAKRGDRQQGNLSHSGSESTRSIWRSFALQRLTEPLIFLFPDTPGLSGDVCPFSLVVGAFMAEARVLWRSPRRRPSLLGFCHRGRWCRQTPVRVEASSAWL